MRKIRSLIYLKEVLKLGVTAFGGPQAHLALFFDIFVEKRAYLSNKELIELHALCQILPGPTSTQTITAIGYRIGGPKLAYLTLLAWCLPAVTVMTAVGFALSYLNNPLSVTEFIQPMVVAIVGIAAIRISNKVVVSNHGLIIMIITALAAYFYRSPFAYPALIIIGGLSTAINFKLHPKENNKKLNINWSNFLLWGGVLIAAAILGAITNKREILLFENFYRNGSLIFGGGQVLIPFLYTEFVEFKQYLTSNEFLSGYGFNQAVPGPTFSFAAFVGTLSMRDYGFTGQIIGAYLSAAGIFLPGTFLIFFIIRFWDELKKYRIIKASLEGVNAAGSGLVVAAAFLLFEPLDKNPMSFGIILITLGLMTLKVRTPYIIIAGVIAGFIF
ncbi:chromate efflux transporter [Marinigracilibium pacificum]|uniref:Chromate efflux transporter n=1 Tax=Marinigracilibium pacificum TaxID=2729599 RepID=A0A848J380_9BACT|nr:chromate efflux transporter [Marinigracilibium pacificum]NMM49788.1 chromate efflux transporter [Marinigracilibium pacificum]